VRLAQAIEKPLLNVVRVLVLVDHDVSHRLLDGRSCRLVIEEVEKELLNMSEINAILLDEGFFVSDVYRAQRLDERIT
jgi:hypothetical protein